MASSMHFHGVKATLNPRLTSNSPSLPSFRNLNFGASICSHQCRFNNTSLSISNSKRTFTVNCLRVEEKNTHSDQNANVDHFNNEFTVVMKFGGSSVASAERMKEVADLILSFPDEIPVVVLSAMGKTTNNLLNAGEKAVSCGVSKASYIPELAAIKDLHFR
ncbi:Aspartokinase 3 chloroplastic [Bienertia sinuspersici]